MNADLLYVGIHLSSIDPNASISNPAGDYTFFIHLQ